MKSQLRRAGNMTPKHMLTMNVEEVTALEIRPGLHQPAASDLYGHVPTPFSVLSL